MRLPDLDDKWYHAQMKAFYQFLANTIIASVTNSTVWFSLVFYTYLQTRAVLATSLLSGIYLAAVAITGLWFGSLIDHHRKKQVMLVGSCVSMVLYVIGLAIYLLVDPTVFAQINSLWLWIFASVLLSGVVVSSIRNIALPTVVTLMVPEDGRDKANGLAGTANGIAFLVTSVISGILVGHSGMLWVLILAVISTGVTLSHLLSLNITETKIQHVPGATHLSKLDLAGTLKAIGAVPGLLALIFFTMFNNFLGGVYMALMDAYGLSLVSVQTWGWLWGGLSCAFIIGGAIIAKFGLGKNPLRSMFLANLVIWSVSSVFTIYPSIILLGVGMFIYLAVVPFIQAAEFTIIQKVVPVDRQGRVFGFAQSVEQAASPLTAFAIGPLAQFVFIPFMTTGAGVDLIGGWFGTGADRGIALVFTLAGMIGLCTTIWAMKSKYYTLLSKHYSK